MMAVNWAAVALGGGIGTITGALFFWGLAFGMRHALRSESPVKALVLSAVLRITVLLAVGWIVATQAGPWAAVGYALAFFLTRFIATTFAPIGPRGASAS
ncbi:ATP synthase subunit I [Yoonia sp. I 8.24]|uniref:N-ATPase subunit AtpR n=1 Tax=Yoonia sp. I 8.24 TaxID=1537229 RepID=UPI001EE066E3|nr:ATP synthase subunit I [Yoonia sp. I 8.24]MCG3268544.1 ATP synthase subunit AtpR [Yoonia sp. I 8.24]